MKCDKLSTINLAVFSSTIQRIWRAVIVFLASASQSSSASLSTLHSLRFYVHPRNKLISLHILLVCAYPFTTTFSLMQIILVSIMCELQSFDCGLKNSGYGLCTPKKLAHRSLQPMLFVDYNFITTFPLMQKMNAGDTGLHFFVSNGPFRTQKIRLFLLTPQKLAYNGVCM